MTDAKFYAQGDILIERVASVDPTGRLPVVPDPDGAVVLARGEVTGHRHAIYRGAVMFRDDGLASDMPAPLYIGHIQVTADEAALRHEEHDTIRLPKGTYRVRRQREFDPDVDGLIHAHIIED